jgi:hypothetical protein
MLFCQQNRYIAYIKITNRLFENVSQFKYLGTAVTNQNLTQEEFKRRLNSGKVCHHSIHKLLSPRLQLKNVKIRIYKTINLLVVLYGYEIWSLALTFKCGNFETMVVRVGRTIFKCLFQLLVILRAPKIY